MMKTRLKVLFCVLVAFLSGCGGGGGGFDLAIGLGRNGYGWIEVQHNNGQGVLSPASWLQVTNISGYNTTDRVGFTFPTWGDLDGDGKDDLIVGLGPASGGNIDVFNAANWAQTLVKIGGSNYNGLSHAAYAHP